MSKLLCKLCHELISPDDPNFQTVHENGGRLVVVERHGRAHILFNQRETEEHLDPPSEVEYQVRPRTPEPKPEPEPTPTPAVAEVVDAEQPVTLEELVEPESRESTVEEFDGYFDEINSEFGSGFIRIIWEQRKQGLNKVIFDKRDVVTEGEIKVGKMVRFQIVPPDPGRTMNRAKDIRIYQDQEQS